MYTMNTNPDDPNRLPEEEQIDQVVQQAFQGELPSEVEGRMDGHFESMRARMEKPFQRKSYSAWNLSRFIWATTGALSALAVFVIVAAELMVCLLFRCLTLKYQSSIFMSTK